MSPPACTRQTNLPHASSFTMSLPTSMGGPALLLLGSMRTRFPFGPPIAHIAPSPANGPHPPLSAGRIVMPVTLWVAASTREISFEKLSVQTEFSRKSELVGLGLGPGMLTVVVARSSASTRVSVPSLPLAIQKAPPPAVPNWAFDDSATGLPTVGSVELAPPPSPPLPLV